MKKRAAFTLVECISALIVTSIVVLLIGYAMTSVRTMVKRSLSNTVDWQICLQELESSNHHFVLQHANSKSIFLLEQTSGREFELRALDRLYLRASNGGYVPIFSGIKMDRTVFRQLDDQRVYIKVERDNGQELTGIACFEADK